MRNKNLQHRDIKSETNYCTVIIVIVTVIVQCSRELRSPSKVSLFHSLSIKPSINLWFSSKITKIQLFSHQLPPVKLFRFFRAFSNTMITFILFIIMTGIAFDLICLCRNVLQVGKRSSYVNCDMLKMLFIIPPKLFVLNRNTNTHKLSSALTFQQISM